MDGRRLNNNLYFCIDENDDAIDMKKNKNQYAQANKDWLAAKSKEDGVMALPKGVYYKVLAEGDHSGATPTPG